MRNLIGGQFQRPCNDQCPLATLTLGNSPGMASWYQGPAALDLDRKWSIFVDREELLLWAEVLKYSCDLFKFVFVVRVGASQNFLGLPVTITRPAALQSDRSHNP